MHAPVHCGTQARMWAGKLRDGFADMWAGMVAQCMVAHAPCSAGGMRAPLGGWTGGGRCCMLHAMRPRWHATPAPVLHPRGQLQRHHEANHPHPHARPHLACTWHGTRGSCAQTPPPGTAPTPPTVCALPSALSVMTMACLLSSATMLMSAFHTTYFTGGVGSSARLRRCWTSKRVTYGGGRGGGGKGAESRCGAKSEEPRAMGKGGCGCPSRLLSSSALPSLLRTVPT